MDIFTLTPEEQAALDFAKYSLTFHIVSWFAILSTLFYVVKINL